MMRRKPVINPTGRIRNAEQSLDAPFPSFSAKTRVTGLMTFSRAPSTFLRKRKTSEPSSSNGSTPCINSVSLSAVRTPPILSNTHLAFKSADCFVHISIINCCRHRSSFQHARPRADTSKHVIRRTRIVQGSRQVNSRCLALEISTGCVVAQANYLRVIFSALPSSRARTH